MTMATEFNAHWAMAFFATALLMQYWLGGTLSEQGPIRAFGLLFQLPVFVVQAVAQSVAAATPLAVLAVIALFIAYRHALGGTAYLVIYGCMAVLVLGL